MKAYKTVAGYGSSELIEKKSRFLSFVYDVSDEAEVIELIEKMKKKYYDSTHVVFAYKLKKNNITRFSDDGEPQGTAGIPVLDVINKSEIDNVLIIVVRYFGGTLLGAGGLVRAYSKVAVMGVENAGICEMTPCVCFEINCPYSMLSSLQFLLESSECVKLDIEYMQEIRLRYYISEDKYEALKEKITDKTSGKFIPKITDKGFYKMQ